MQHYIGIDYSLSCPAVTVTTDGKFKNSKFFFLTTKTKFVGQWDNIQGQLHQEWTHPIDRYEHIADWVIDILPFSSSVAIEDYSMASKGKVFHIAENTAVLKYKLRKSGFDYITVPPKSLKKFASGNGNANKSLMYGAWMTDININLHTILGAKETTQVDSPISDLVDSYYLARYLVNI